MRKGSACDFISEQPGPLFGADTGVQREPEFALPAKGAAYMRIACAQMRVLPGRPEENFRRMRAFVAEAKDAGCAIVIFPEMCVGGYLLGDRWLDEGFCRELMAYNDLLRELSGDIAIVYGNVYLDSCARNKDGRTRKYNAVYAFFEKKPLGRQRPCPLPDGLTFKTLLPNYRFFDDERYFYSLADLSLEMGADIESLLMPFHFVHRDGEIVIGCEVCEDLWCDDYSYRGKPLNVSRILMDNGAQMIFNVSASPWTWGKGASRERRIMAVLDDAGRFVPFYYVNCVGVQNNGKNFVTFDGDSTIYGEDGRIIDEIERPYAERLLVHDSSSVNSRACPGEAPSVSKPEAQYLAAIEGIRAVDDIGGSSDFPYIIGLSGGVDSALVAALVERAVGKERVQLFNLPSRYNSQATKDVAAHVAAALDLALCELSIEDMLAANAKLLDRFNPSAFNLENVQAKIRGSSILSNIAGIHGGMMTCNGNKVEIALGYATLYGDVNGVLAPIGDLLKTEVFELSAYINDVVFSRELIPRKLLPDSRFNFGIAPTAELKNAQRDPMKWGYHDALVREFTTYWRKSAEDVLEWYLGAELAERLDIDKALLSLYGLDEPKCFIDDLEWFVNSMQRAVFKRVQSPPVIVMSRGAFGYDLRESQLPLYQTERYRELRERVLGRSEQ